MQASCCPPYGTAKCADPAPAVLRYSAHHCSRWCGDDELSFRPLIMKCFGDGERLHHPGQLGVAGMC